VSTKWWFAPASREGGALRLFASSEASGFRDHRISILVCLYNPASGDANRRRRRTWQRLHPVAAIGMSDGGDRIMQYRYLCRLSIAFLATITDRWRSRACRSFWSGSLRSGRHPRQWVDGKAPCSPPTYGYRDRGYAGDVFDPQGAA